MFEVIRPRPVTEQGATFSRASAATYIKAGVVYSVGNNVLRIDDDGAVLEGAATNLLLRSEEFDNAAWTKINVTVTGNSTAAPDGTTTADTLADSSPVSVGLAVQNPAATVAGTYALSGFFKASTSSLVSVTFADDGLINANIDFTLTGDGAATVRSGATPSALEITALANGWYRFVIELALAPTANLTVTVQPSRASVAGGANVNGLQNAVYAWGFQVEEGSATSYFKTTSASATRAADSFGSGQGLLYSSVDPDVFIDPEGVTHTLVEWDNATLYEVGDYVYVDDGDTRRVFRSQRGEDIDVVPQVGVPGSFRWADGRLRELEADLAVRFTSTGGTPPTEMPNNGSDYILDDGVTAYFVYAAEPEGFSISFAPGGAPIPFLGAGDATTVTAKISVNVGNDPLTSADDLWLEVDTPLRMAMFDGEVYTTTYAEDELTTIFAPGRAAGIGFRGLIGEQLRLAVYDRETTPGTMVLAYSASITLLADGVEDWERDVEQISRAMLTDLPGDLADPVIAVTITGEGTVGIGVCATGDVFQLGTTQVNAEPESGIFDYGTDGYDPFGRFVRNDKPTVDLIACETHLEKARINAFVNLRRLLRGVACFWRLDDDPDYAEPMIAFGRYEDMTLRRNSAGTAFVKFNIRNSI